ncbi:MAG: class I SAM-dependent methyltransferase [Alphaproteobacteria bacterium]|nr:class I SAM-dependent methyltransferase [Alphaproteobacteria bacterium]
MTGSEAETRARHLRITEPSPWVARFAHLIPPKGPVLDLACGGGRHARFFARRGHKVTAVDRDTAALAADAPQGIEDVEGVEVVAADLENGPAPFAPGGALAGRRFAGIVVVNYLHRPLFPALLSALEPGGVLLYETFARGNERFNRPRNPDHLLREGELLDLARGKLHVVAYEHGLVENPESPGDIPGVKQRLAAVAAPAEGSFYPLKAPFSR